MLLSPVNLLKDMKVIFSFDDSELLVDRMLECISISAWKKWRSHFKFFITNDPAYCTPTGSSKACLMAFTVKLFMGLINIVRS
jgi:hypothetical protein